MEGNKKNILIIGVKQSLFKIVILVDLVMLRLEISPNNLTSVNKFFKSRNLSNPFVVTVVICGIITAYFE